ncbi:MULTISPECIES: hypothetical protein [unclassified Nocardia]|uniref:hypothetical protein n=1 Tax=unclassified Nocardia TaxID=2637762 RepID=UPI003447D964
MPAWTGPFRPAACETAARLESQHHTLQTSILELETADGIAACSAVLYDRTGQLGTCVVTALSNAARRVDLARPLDLANR